MVLAANNAAAVATIVLDFILFPLPFVVRMPAAAGTAAKVSAALRNRTTHESGRKVGGRRRGPAAPALENGTVR